LTVRLGSRLAEPKDWDSHDPQTTIQINKSTIAYSGGFSGGWSVFDVRMSNVQVDFLFGETSEAYRYEVAISGQSRVLEKRIQLRPAATTVSAP